ncbi:RNA helicase aquarius-like [Corticium candelabrum]|uniref:RNA helicase aquarius-like n=1 Tax=Corticium candelabrum TaxID=121492 RepID=UPI002E27212F|nr:RNA helicase aquarius-like [Corticium candelabrum]
MILIVICSQYLENYLWPNFDAEQASDAHVMSIVVMVNEKFRENVPAWETFKASPDKMPSFFQRVLTACVDDFEDFSIKEQTVLLIFLINCFKSLEEELIREQVQRVVSLPMWTCLLPARLRLELKATPRLKKYWNALEKRDAQMDPVTRKRVEKERKFLSRLIQRFFGILESIPKAGHVKLEKVEYCTRFIELLVDLESMLPTRRFFNTVLDDNHLVIRCRLSALSHRQPEGRLFNQMLDMLKFYAGFEINDQTGLALTDHDMLDIHYDKITSLQRVTFKHFEELKYFAMSSVAEIDKRDSLLKHFKPLTNATLHKIAAHLCLLPQPDTQMEKETYSTNFLVELLVSRHERRISQIEALNEMPLYPTEEVLWDENVVPSEFFSGESCLALPKLNLQFLTLHDYLLRNLNLFRLESTYEIKEDIQDVVGRMKPWMMEDGTTGFSGWARMAQPITSFTIVEVAKPKIGENRPSRVRADIQLTLSVRPAIKTEWEALRKHDVLFLISCRMARSFDASKPFRERYGIAYVRGCEVQGMLDDTGKLIEENPFEAKPELDGDARTFRVWLDTNQYQQDMAATLKGAEDVYDSFNILMRRRPKENNFKAVLETIRSLMNTECVVPDWVHDVFVGYSDPAAANYKQLPNYIETMDWNDTFLDMEHLKACFPDCDMQFTQDDLKKQVPPFRLSIPRQKGTQSQSEKPVVIVEPYKVENRGPYPYDQPKKNAIPFTPTQVEAIKSGMQPGLTLVVGPPGTGKTDVAVQIISNLYHNYPNQRTLLVTHSNQALNQLFEKILELDIEERHLLRLGHGEEELETDKDFSRYGRVNLILHKRLELLAEVQRLQDSLDIQGDVSYTCETAGHFFRFQIVGRWKTFLGKIQSRSGKDLDVSVISKEFPFHKYYETAPKPLFKGQSYEEDLDIAEGCFRHIEKIFTQLDEFRGFELLRRGGDRTNYLLVKEAKIIAMTCTHAALKRQDMVELSFQYDNVLMEEAAQILEIETFIPLMLQKPQDGVSRLKRMILIGDHHQLPPVIKNMAFQKFCNMEQSLFTRFVRLGVPTVDLDAQGRSRASLCSLYSWRYKNLGNLPHVYRWPEYLMANPGFFYDFQLIDVGDFNGQGESQPTPYYYQNLAEAEYVVAVYMYMRLQGYPASKITILTTYNGQKHLIRDVLKQRCGKNPFFGIPDKVTSVDRFQGQQNDYILLSLVRTKAVGHLRDVRRLVVALSRARLGLYVFARVSVFRNCYELSPAFSQLMERPLNLYLAPEEMYPPCRKSDELPPSHPFIVEDMPRMAHYVYHLYNRRMQEMQSQTRAFHQSIPMQPPPVEKQQERPRTQTQDQTDENLEEAVDDDDDDDPSGHEPAESEKAVEDSKVVSQCDDDENRDETETRTNQETVINEEGNQ